MQEFTEQQLFASAEELVRSTGEDAHVYDPVRLLRLVGAGSHLHHGGLAEKLLERLNMSVFESERALADFVHPLFLLRGDEAQHEDD